MKNLKIFSKLIKDIKPSLVIFISITIMVGFIEFLNVTVFFPLIQLLFVGTDPDLGNLSKFLLQYIDLNILLIFIPFLMIIQSTIAILNEQYFIKVLAKWRAQKSIEYLESIWTGKYSDQKSLENGKIEVVISRNLGFSVKLRHLTALMISEFVLSFILVCTSIYINFLTSFLFLVLGSSYFFLNKVTISRRVKNTEEVKKGFNDVANLTSQIFPDYRMLNFYRFKNLRNIFADPVFKACNAQYRTDKINIFLKHLLQPIAIIMIFLMGIFISKYDIISIPEFVIISFLFYRAAPKLVTSIRLYGEIAGEAPIDITNDLFPQESDIYKNVENVTSRNLSLSLEDLTYSLEDDRVIKFPNTTLKNGDTLLITGPSGSGKSTFLDVLCGFKQQDSGRMLFNIDGKNIKIDRNVLIKYFSIFRQESLIFRGTIEENISFHSDNIKIQDILNICEKLEINKFWDKNLNLKTNVGDFGRKISAGQRQRILLARALVRKPKVIILDEPTSNLDENSERLILEIIKSYQKETITIIVSHDHLFQEMASHKFDLSQNI